MKFVFLTFIFSVFSYKIALAQPTTVGLIENNNPTEGFTLFSPEKNNSTYLINNCGEKINSWTFSETPGLTAYLLENGNLLRAGKDSLEIRDWDNNLVWSYAMNLNGYKQHHDIEPLPNGNILCILGDVYTSNEMIAEGRNPALLSGDLRLDKIIELQPVGTNDANVVWEWKFIDHLVQDFDASKNNYGDVMNSPHLININYDNGNNFDWMHLNAVDYNAELDQILLSSRQLSEIYIIDHSTTIAEAAGHSGGNFGMGGDILWRWGNPQVNMNGSANDQKLSGQHDAKWIPNGYADYGAISVFSNFGNNVDLESYIHLITPSISMNQYEKNGNLFLPADYTWSWTGLIGGEQVFEDKKSGVHFLPNGNFLVCETSLGQLTELDKSGNVEWRYKNPVSFSIFDQFSAPASNTNGIFRGTRYSETYVGFVGKDISTKGLIENENSLSATCQQSANTEQLVKFDVNIINPVVGNFIQFDQIIEAESIELVNAQGKLIYRQHNFMGNRVDVNLSKGIYFLRIEDQQNQLESIKVVVH